MLQQAEAAGGFWNRRVSIRRLAGYLSMFSEHREDVATAKSCATCRRVADYTIGGSSSKGQRSGSTDGQSVVLQGSPLNTDCPRFGVCEMSGHIDRNGGICFEGEQVARDPRETTMLPSHPSRSLTYSCESQSSVADPLLCAQHRRASDIDTHLANILQRDMHGRTK